MNITRRALFGGIAFLATSKITSAQEMREVTIAVSSGSMAAAVTRIADALGLFAKHKLVPRNIIMESGNAATSALISQSVDFAVSGPSELIAVQARGQKVLAIATAYGSVAGVLVLNKEVAKGLSTDVGSPIAGRLRALDGLLIAAISPTSISPLGVRLAAKDVGGNLRYTYMSQEAMPAALDSGAVQGILASAPMWAAPVSKGTGVRWLNASEIPYKFRTTHAVSLQVMKSFSEQNPDVIKSMVDILNDVNNAIDNSPADVKAAISKLFPQIDQPSLDLLYEVEAPLWKSRSISEDDMKHEIELVKGATVSEDLAKDLDPAAMLYRQ
ncbi:MAG: ABC transporter substrate-binding protein [Phyllobacterium sp.]